MRADLIERLRWNAKMSRGDHRHITADLLDEAADALASLSSPQEPIGYVHPEDITEMKEFGRCYIWKSPVKNGYPLFTSPVVPVAAKAEVEGWRLIDGPDPAPKNWTNLILYDPERDPPVFEGYYSMADGGSDCWMDDRTMASQEVSPTHWMPLPAAPTCEGEGQPQSLEAREP